MSNPLAVSLISTFFKRSLWIVGILTVLLAIAVPVTIYRYHVEQYEAESANLLTNFIRTELASQDPEVVLADPVRGRKVIERINIFMGFGQLVEFKIWQDDATLLYAFADRAQVGRRFPENRRLAETIRRGETTVEIESTRDSENLTLRPFGRLVEMYAPMRVGGRVVGAVEVYRKSPEFRFLTSHIILVVAIAVVILALLYVLLYGQFRRAATELVRNDQQLEEAFRSLGLTYFETIRSLIKALELRDMETEGHSERVVALSVHLGEKLGLSAEELDKLVLGSYLHDIGKIGVPDQVLLKPGELSTAEREVINTHVEKGLGIIGDIAFLQPAREVVHYHHERWDGSGYLQGVSGPAIPITARIFAVVDVFDAMVNDRPYRQALPFAEARRILREERGKQFDPAIVDLFLTASEEELAAILQNFQERGIAPILNDTVSHLLDRFTQQRTGV
jgi:HD-GYP domain-containing protein (c-di-GMP phosphodiesterase class II)